MNTRANLTATLILAALGSLTACAGTNGPDLSWGDDASDASDEFPSFGDDAQGHLPVGNDAAAPGADAGGGYASSGSSGSSSGGTSSSGTGSSSGGYPNGSSSGGGGGSSSSGGKYMCGMPTCSLDGNGDCGCTWTDSTGNFHGYGCVLSAGCGCYNSQHAVQGTVTLDLGACATTATAAQHALAQCCN